MNKEAISRKDFLKNLGLGGAALMAVLTSCTNASSDVTPANPSGSSIDLSSNLLKVGDYTYVGSVIVARIAAGNTASSFVAVSKACTHEETTVIYQSSTSRFYCPNHQATFSTSGKVTGGPARTDLTQFNVTVEGNMLKIA